MNEKTQWKKNDEENNLNNQQKSVDWLKWYKQDKLIRRMKRRMNKMIWRLINSNRLISVFISLFHFTIYWKMPNQELTNQKEKSVLFIKNLDKIDQKLPRFFCVFIKNF